MECLNARVRVLQVCSILLTGWLIGASTPGCATANGRFIAVEGQACVQVVPDEAVLTLGIETLGQDLGKVRAENERRMLAMLEVADEHDVPREWVQTEKLRVEPIYRDPREPLSLQGYLTRRRVTIRLHDLTALEVLVAAMLESGATHVHDVFYGTEAVHAHREEARKLALQAAREKAVAMAQELDERVGRPLKIEEHPMSAWSGYPHWRVGALSNAETTVESDDDAFGGPVAPGQIAIRAHVAVTFELVD